MLQITMTHVLAAPDCGQALRAEFDSTGIARLPGFLSPEVLAFLLKKIKASDFYSKNEVGKNSGAVFGTTLVMPADKPVMVALHFLMNRPELFELAAQVCGARPGNFLCRMHRTQPDSAQHIDWHSDATETRMLGLNINLGTDTFTGGLFQLRDENERITAEIRHTTPGDAFLFRIDRGWQHRLTRVESGTRTVAVGWFRALPEWQGLTLIPDQPE